MERTRGFYGNYSFLKHRKLPIHGLVVGDVHPNKKSYYQILKKKLYRLKLNKTITFLGHRKDIHQIMYCSDLIVSCSKDPEAFGRVTLEALSIGKPVFAYAHGGVREQLAELLPEGMIKPNKLSSMKTKLAQYIESEKSLKPKENKRFTLEVMNAKILKVYESFYNNIMINKSITHIITILWRTIYKPCNPLIRLKKLV